MFILVTLVARGETIWAQEKGLLLLIVLSASVSLHQQLCVPIPLLPLHHNQKIL